MTRRIFTAVAVAVFTVTCASAQLLYRVSGNNLKASSYIIGTHHLANVGFVDKIAGVKDALTATEQVYGELDWDVMTNPDSLKLLQQAMMLPEGQTLKTVLSPQQFEKLDAYLKTAMGVGFDNPIVMAQMGHLCPAAVTVKLQVMMFLQKHVGEFDPSSTFDQYFQAQAKKNNEPCGGLETMSFQTDVLYGRTDIKRQAEQLVCLIDNAAYNVELMEKMTEAFYAQNLEALMQAMLAKIGSKCDSTPEELATLIYNRNADWAAKMPAVMAERPTFFAVGAGHLPGPKGILQLLRNAGYSVEPVK